MAKICCFKGTSPALPIQLRKQHCSKSNTPNSRKTCAIHNMKTEKNETSQLLKIAVSGVTELLRLFTPFQQTWYYTVYEARTLVCLVIDTCVTHVVLFNHFNFIKLLSAATCLCMLQMISKAIRILFH